MLTKKYECLQGYSSSRIKTQVKNSKQYICMSQNQEVFSFPNHLFPRQKGRKDLVNIVKELSAHKRGAQTSTRGLGSSMQKPAPFTVQHSGMHNCSLLWTGYGCKTYCTHRILPAETRNGAGLLAFLLSRSRDGIFYYLVLGWGDAEQSPPAYL